MNKEFTAKTNENKLDSEEIRTMGKQISPNQIWRDGQLIPGSPNGLTWDLETDYKAVSLSGRAYTYDTYIYSVNSLKEANYNGILIRKYVKLPLLPYQGNDHIYFDMQGALIDLIDRSFDGLDNESGSWQYYLEYSTDGTNMIRLPYGAGNTIVDISSGLLYFRDKDWVKDNLNKYNEYPQIYITFYKYVGRKGFFGSKEGLSLPFEDVNPLLKSKDNHKKTVRFNVSTKTEGEHVYNIGDDVKLDGSRDTLGVYTPKDQLIGNVMTAETYQEIDWQIGLHNGGRWRKDSNGNVTVSKN